MVRTEYEEDWDYDWEENPVYLTTRESYVTSDEEIFSDKEDAVEHEMVWLDADCTKSSVCAEYQINDVKKEFQRLNDLFKNGLAGGQKIF